MENTCECAHLPLIGQKAPSFEAVSTQGTIKFPDNYAGKWVIFFSHPADFTPVCTTELMTFGAMNEEFESLNCKLIGLSIDSHFSHIAWLRIIADRIEYRGMKKIEVKYPVIADLKMDVAKKYGMVQPYESEVSAVRAVFFIDPEAKIRAIIYYPLSLGRNFAEIKRALIAMQTADKYSVSTPADWQPGDDVIVPAPASCDKAKERVANAKEQGLKCLDWFLSLKPLNLNQGK